MQPVSAAQRYRVSIHSQPCDREKRSLSLPRRPRSDGFQSTPSLATGRSELYAEAGIDDALVSIHSQPCDREKQNRCFTQLSPGLFQSTPSLATGRSAGTRYPVPLRRVSIHSQPCDREKRQVSGCIRPRRHVSIHSQPCDREKRFVMLIR